MIHSISENLVLIRQRILAQTLNTVTTRIVKEPVLNSLIPATSRWQAQQGRYGPHYYRFPHPPNPLLSYLPAWVGYGLSGVIVLPVTVESKRMAFDINARAGLRSQMFLGNGVVGNFDDDSRVREPELAAKRTLQELGDECIVKCTLIYL